MRVIERPGGVRLHVREDGDPAGRPVIFANSLGTDLRVWDPLLPCLPAGLRILRWDQRGHGLSDAPPPPYAMDDHVDDCLAVLDAHGVSEPAVIIGLSIGGMIAQAMWARAPARLSGAALVDTGHVIATPEVWNDRIAAVESGGIESLADAVMTRWFSAPFRASRPDLALWRNMLTRTTPQGYQGSCAAIRDSDFTAVAPTITIPTICVVGTEDGSTPPALMKELAALIPGAGYAEIDGAGHIPCVEAPDRLGAILSGFLAENGFV